MKLSLPIYYLLLGRSSQCRLVSFVLSFLVKVTLEECDPANVDTRWKRAMWIAHDPPEGEINLHCVVRDYERIFHCVSHSCVHPFLHIRLFLFTCHDKIQIAQTMAADPQKQFLLLLKTLLDSPIPETDWTSAHPLLVNLQKILPSSSNLEIPFGNFYAWNFKIKTTANGVLVDLFSVSNSHNFRFYFVIAA